MINHDTIKEPFLCVAFFLENIGEEEEKITIEPLMTHVKKKFMTIIYKSFGCIRIGLL